MRSRRQTVSDTVGTLSMDPWNDDRVRDFVAINTIQRLRAYHLPTSAPMPVIDEVNTARALNLILLPRADPDYRPCLGEQPPSRTQLRARRRATARQERRERRQRQQEGASRGGQGGCSPESPSTTVSTSSSSDDGSNVDDDTAIEHGATLSMTNSSFSTDTATPTKQARPRSPVASGAAAAAAPPRQCAIDRARSLFFGALSFTSSTSPRRLVNSPHVPLTPSIASTTTIAGRSSMHVPRSPKEAFLSTTASPLSPDARAAQRRAGREVAAVAMEEGSVTAMPAAPPAPSATRSLGMELDAHIEANSTPLRPPPPMRYVDISAEAQTPVSAEANASESDVSPNSSAVVASHDASKSEADALCESTPTKATPAVVRPPSPRLAGAEGGRTTTPPPSRGGRRRSSSSSTDIVHTCDVCDAIIQYYQSMLTRGVVLDRYNHKDLAFVWWVLGRNMDVAALENRGPMRREALMITLRNFYYTLLTAEEARAKVAAGEAEKSHAEKRELAGTGVPAASAAPGGQTTLSGSADAAATGDQQGEAADTEEHSRRTSGRAAESSDNTADALADASVLRRPPRARPRGSRTASASAASAVSGRQRDSLRAARTASGTAALKRSRLDKPLVSSCSDDEERDDEHLVEEDVGDGADEQERLSVTPSRGRTSVPPLHKKLPHNEDTTLTARRRAVADGALGSSSSATGKGLAAALLGEDEEETVTDVLAAGVDDALDKRADTLHSQTESSVVSRAGSVAQSSTGEIRRHHRRAAERSKAVEETWVSTRTGRRAAAIKAAAQLVLQGTADAMAHRKSIKAVPFTNASGASRTAAAKTLKQEASTTAAVKDAGATAVAVIPSAPAGGSATSELQRKRRTGSKRARSPSRETSPGEGHRSRSSDSGGDSDMELTKAEAKGSNTEAPRMVPRVSASKSKSRAAVFAKASAVKAERVTPAVHPPSGKATGPPFDAPTTTTPDSAAATATASKKGGRGEEHRGRPRGSFKILHVDSSATEDQGNSLLASVTLSSQRRRDGGACSTAVFTGTSSETAAPHQRSDAVSMAVAPSSSSAPSKASEDAVPLQLPVYEMPLRLTLHQRAVRSRIQQRMGVPLPAPPPRSSAGSISDDSGIDAQWATVYSSYTFLLSSFRTATWTRMSQGGGGHERRAITAPVLWYGQAISPVVAGGSISTSSSGADHSRQVRENALAAMLSEDTLVNGGAPSGAAAIATAAGALTRQRGRKRRIEGGVDPSLRGNVLRHDQVALERLVKERLAQAAELRQAAVSRIVGRGQGKCRASGSGTTQVKQEPRSGSEEEEKQDDEVHVLRAKPAVRLPVSPTGASPVVAATTPLNPARRAGEGADATAEEALAPEQRRDNSAQCPLLPQASAFGDLPYAQQCLLVWSAAGLLERHIHRRQMEDARRERLLARCGRMATRRMAARVAAVIQGGIADGNACDNAEDAAAQLTGEFRGGDKDRDSGASGEDSDAPEERTRSGTVGRTSGTSRKADVEEQIDHLEHLSGQSASSRSPSAVSSSASSEERFRKTMRPLPRRVYDYWAAYRRAGDSG